MLQLLHDAFYPKFSPTEVTTVTFCSEVQEDNCDRNRHILFLFQDIRKHLREQKPLDAIDNDYDNGDENESETGVHEADADCDCDEEDNSVSTGGR